MPISFSRTYEEIDSFWNLEFLLKHFEKNTFLRFSEVFSEVSRQIGDKKCKGDDVIFYLIGNPLDSVGNLPRYLWSVEDVQFDTFICYQIISSQQVKIFGSYFLQEDSRPEKGVNFFEENVMFNSAQEVAKNMVEDVERYREFNKFDIITENKI